VCVEILSREGTVFEVGVRTRNSNLETLQPSFRERIELILADMVSRGFDPLVFETGRTAERQQHLWWIGRRGRRGERPVTWSKTSRHCLGAACDIISKGTWWADYNFFRVLATVAEMHGCKTLPHDRCHVELK